MIVFSLVYIHGMGCHQYDGFPQFLQANVFLVAPSGDPIEYNRNIFLLLELFYIRPASFSLKNQRIDGY